MEGLNLDQAELERLVELDRKFAREGLTFDDVLLVPAESRVLPNDVSTRTRLTRGIELAIPIVSAAMDTVTEARLAIALAREGGIGVLHRNLPIEDQVAEVDKVKRSESGMIVEPVTLPPDAPVSTALELMSTYHISGVPITDDEGKLLGILTNRDLRFAPDATQPVRSLMTARDLVTAPVGTTLAEAEATEALIDAGADAVKAGVGPGSICTTRVVAGVGVPQITAIYDCAQVAVRHDVPLIADGGMTSSGDIAKAIAAGADAIMAGSLLAGTDESPGEVVLQQGERFKEYRGMGSLGAMRARGFSKDRYFQGG